VIDTIAARNITNVTIKMATRMAIKVSTSVIKEVLDKPRTGALDSLSSIVRGKGARLQKMFLHNRFKTYADGRRRRYFGKEIEE